MTITGYHGTSHTSALQILSSSEFHMSVGEEHWLGDGIYFYEEYVAAQMWKNNQEDSSILHIVAEIDDDAYIDFDTVDGKLFFEKIKRFLKESNTSFYKMKDEKGSVIKNQCAVCNWIWNTQKSIVMLCASFATAPEILRTLLDTRPRRREYCLRDNSPIDSITLIE